MAIVCPRCGRGYDATLFQFGRTISCTCGARVAGRVQEWPVRRGGDLRFLCDAMLGRLARWLRTLGYDTAFERGIRDRALVRRARREERAILTRDTGLAAEWCLGPCLVLEAEEPLERLGEVADAFELPWPRPLFRRCLECNEPLKRASPADVRGAVPPAVRDSRSRFRRCPSCRKVYWRGSHTRRMREALEGTLGDGAGPD